MDDGVWRASPLWEGGNIVAEGGVVDLVDEDAEESCSLVIRVRLELRVELDNECGGDSGEQTSLRPLLARGPEPRTKLTKIKVVFKSSSYFFMVSLSYSSASLR